MRKRAECSTLDTQNRINLTHGGLHHESQPLLNPAKRMTKSNKNHPGAKMTTNYVINYTNTRQHKLCKSKNNMEQFARYLLQNTERT